MPKNKRTNRDELLNFYSEKDFFSKLKKDRPKYFLRLNQPTYQCELAQLLLLWRFKTGKRQQDVAKGSGCGLSTYERLEEVTKNANPRVKTLDGIAKYYGCKSMKEFFYGPNNNSYVTID